MYLKMYHRNMFRVWRMSDVNVHKLSSYELQCVTYNLWNEAEHVLAIGNSDFVIMKW